MYFSAALLAGGRSTRMGRDKAFIEIDGVPLWQRQLRILRELGPSEIFIAGPPRPEWSEAGLEVVPDAASNAGPLAGLVAVLRRCTTPRLLALAVDLPNMSSFYLQRLLSSCGSGKGMIPRNGEQFEPLAAVYPAVCLPLAESLLEAGRLSLQELAECCVVEGFVRLTSISSNERLLFLNVNTPADWDATCRRGLPTRRTGDIASLNTSQCPHAAASGDAAYIK